MFLKYVLILPLTLLLSLTNTPCTHAAPSADTVTFPVEFRVGGEGGIQNVEGARVILIDRHGRVISQGTTDRFGDFRPIVTVELDPRFPVKEQIGTVTVLTVANGYNEQVTFDVPVKAAAGQTILLRKLTKEGRNEPTFSLGNLHRFDVFSLVDKYAAETGLKRQPHPLYDEYAPWGPELQK